MLNNYHSRVKIKKLALIELAKAGAPKPKLGDIGSFGKFSMHELACAFSNYAPIWPFGLFDNADSGLYNKICHQLL